MRIEGIQFVAAFAGTIAATCIVVAPRRRRAATIPALAIGIVAVSCVVALEAIRPPRLDEHEVADRPIRARDRGFARAGACRACHPHQWATWHGSYHRTMTRVASPESVMAGFDGGVHSVLDQRFRLTRDGDEFFVDFESSSGAATGRRPIVMTTGSHHMQAYWYSTGDRREVALLPLVWLRDDARWIPERASFLKPRWEHLGVDKLPDTAGLWNHGCQQCHATAPQPRVDEKDTRAADLGIACEACHGPGDEHVRVNRDSLRRYCAHLGDTDDPAAGEAIVHPARLDPKRASEVCGQCHGIWQAIDDAEAERANAGGFSFRPGDELETSKFAIHQGNIALPRVQAILVAQGGDRHFLADRYWGDGLVRVTGREYSGLRDSPCFRDATSDERRLSCLSCHVMHPTSDESSAIEEWADDQLRPGMRGNDACLPCHETLRESSALSTHTRHRAGSPGSQCYNCHMPYTTYGLMKAIRSHTVSSPSAMESARVGRPNACNLCHLDRTLSWTAGELETGWGVEKPVLAPDDERISAAVLWLLRGDAGQRALVAFACGQRDGQQASGTDWMLPFLAPLLIDPYDAVRFIAHRSLRGLPGFQDFEFDFLAPDVVRQQAVATASRRWLSRGGSRSRKPELLFDADGRFDRETMERLYGQRDDGRVHLEE